MPASWKIVRVFISSTFRDMQAERDHLVRFVFPRLREQLLSRRIHLVDVDLRWGVTSEQDASEVCREIITECRPRFLCILGGRYGTIPEGKELSITADEIHFGVLDAHRERLYGLFYFRHGVVTEKMDKSSPGFIREPRHGEKAAKLAWLKRGIRRAKCKPVLYRPRWNADEQRLVDLKAIGDRVERDILATIDDEFGAEPPAQLDEFAEENAAMEAFVEERSQRFVLGSREAVLEELLAHASATGGNGYLCLTGAPGSGKSALLAHLSQQPALDSQSSTLVIRHFVGASPGSTDVRRTLRRLCHELKAGCPEITADTPDDPEKLRAAFPEFLRQASVKKRVVILIDAVNQFDPTSHSAGPHWLPQQLPEGACIVLSALDSPALEELRGRLKPHEIELQPLTTDDGEAIIEQFRQRYRKRFEPDQRAALLAKADASTPLYLLAALEELRTLGTYEEITGRIGGLPPTTHELFAWILKRLENDDGFRDAAGRQIGQELVSRFATLLGVSRYGLSQRELADLLDPGDPQGNVAALLQLLRPYLMRRGDLCDFYHGQFTAAVKGQYLTTESAQKSVRRSLATYFAGQAIGPRKMDELPWQSERAGEWTQLKDCLVDLEMFVALDERDKSELLRYWVSIWDRFDMVEEYRWALQIREAALPRSSWASRLLCLVRRIVGHPAIVGESHPIVAYSLLLKRVSTFFLDAGRLDAADTLSRHTESVRKSVYGHSNEDAAELSQQGTVATQRGEYDRALLLYRRALEIYQAVCGPEHEYAGILLHNMAMLFCDTKHFNRGEECCRQALRIRERCYGDSHPDVAQSLNALGLLLHKQRRLADAEPYFRRALAIRERCLSSLDPNVAQSLNNLAALLYDRGRRGEAEKMLRKALDLREQALPPDHADLANSYFNLAALLFNNGDRTQAEPLANRALAILEKTRGGNHPETRAARGLVAQIRA